MKTSENPGMKSVSRYQIIMKIVLSTILSAVPAYFITAFFYLMNESEPKINIFTILLFAVLFYFFYKKIKIFPRPIICHGQKQQPFFNSLSDINNLSNPFAYTTPGGIGYRPFETGLEHHQRSSPFSDLDNYNNRF